MIIHKTFLHWLIYISVVVFVVIGLFLVDVVQTTIKYDHAYLTSVLIGVYLLAEFLTAIQIFSVSKTQRQMSNYLTWLRGRKIKSVELNSTGSAILVFQTDNSSFEIPAHSVLGEHILSLIDRAQNDPKHHRIDQQVLLNVLASKLDRRVSICEFMASQIIWIGILATVAGVVLAFWPFMQSGASIDSIKTNITGFFSGIAVAFIPCTASFLFKIALNVNSRILNQNVEEVIDLAAVVSETHIIPYLENHE